MRHNLLLMLIPFSHLLFSLSTAQKEAGGPKVDDPKRQELFQRKGSDRLPVPGVVMKRTPAIMGDSDVHMFSCAQFHSTDACMCPTWDPRGLSCTPPCTLSSHLTPSPICVNEYAWLYLESADVTSGLSEEPITVGVGRCDSLTNPGLLQWRTGICWITRRRVSTHWYGAQRKQLETKTASSATFRVDKF